MLDILGPPREPETSLRTITVRHLTTYTYRKPVELHPHRLMLRPRESRELRLLSSELKISPTAKMDWAEDVRGNALATATFSAPTSLLEIECVSVLEHKADPWPVYNVAYSALSFPFRYSDDEWTDLGGLAMQQYPDPDFRLRRWAQGFVRSNPTDTLSLLKDICAGIPGSISYEVREDEGTQTPIETLERGWGACRDFAVLFAEAVRSLGFGARIVSGYLHDPENESVGTTHTGSTHAWAEVFLPGAGWVTFDPANNALGGFNLIPVAVARDIHQAMPVTGSYAGGPEAFGEMAVEVLVSA